MKEIGVSDLGYAVVSRDRTGVLNPVVKDPNAAEEAGKCT